MLSEYLRQQTLLGTYEVRLNGATSDTGHLLLTFSDTSPSKTSDMLNSNTVEDCGIQIRIRGLPDDQITPRAFLVGLSRNLDILPNTAVTYGSSTYRILAIHKASGPLPLHRDVQRRWEWTLNVTATITQLT